MTSRSKQKVKFECTLAFDRQRATSVILHFLIVPRLCSNIHKKKLVGRWDTFPRRFSYLYLESNHHDRVDDTLRSRAACVCSLGWQATGYMLKVLTFWAKRAVVYIFHVFVNMLDITKTGLPSLVICWWKVLHLGHLNEVSMIIAYLTY